jgi:hypothetical protein
VINLEHILPQSPQGNWPWFSDDDVKVYSRRIGNLALLLAKTNADLQSEEFPKKSAVYRDSPYELTRMVAKNTEWTKDDIINRQKVLAELALKAWPL